MRTRVEGGSIQGIVGAKTVIIENLIYGAVPPVTPSAAEITGNAKIGACPYPGLSRFGPEDREQFYGRDAAISRLLKIVPHQRLTALVGASGTGKSSVALAGLAPRLADSGLWRFSHFRVGTEADTDPFAALARALVPLFLENASAIDRLGEVTKLATKFKSGEISLSAVLSECHARNAGKRILLIADQFEELFTLVSDEAVRRQFVDLIVSGFGTPSAETAPDTCLLITLRADFYGMAIRHRGLSDALQGKVENLGPMTREELADAIEKPAGLVRFEPGLVQTVLDDVANRPGNLPLLQFALREMWFRQENDLISFRAYEAIGKVEGALSRRAQEVFDKITNKGADKERAALFRRLFTRLITLGEGVEDTRRVVERAELGDGAWELAQKLASQDNRLLVTSAPQPGHETAEVVHEALIRNWPTLVNWINRDRAFHSYIRQLKPRVAEWQAHPEDEGTLLRGAPLVAAEDWLNLRRGDLSDEERDFIDASLTAKNSRRAIEEAERKAKLERQQQLTRVQQRLSRVAWALTALAIVAASVVGYFAWQAKQAKNQALADKDRADRQTRVAEERRNIAQARGLAASARPLADQGATKLQLAALLAAESLRLEPSALADSTARIILSRMLLPLQVVRPAHEVRYIAVSPDGRYLAARFRNDASEPPEELVAVFDTDRGAEIARSKIASLSTGYQMHFSSDGSALGIPTNEGMLLWHWPTSNPPVSIPSLARQEPIFSGNGKWVLGEVDEGVIEVHGVPDGVLARRLQPPVTRAEYIQMSSASAFGYDSNLIVVGYSDGQVAVFDVAQGKLLSTFNNHSTQLTPMLQVPPCETAYRPRSDGITESEYIRNIVGSPDGTRVVTLNDDDVLRLWSISGGHVDLIRGIPSMDFAEAAFSKDGSLLALSNRTGCVSVWDARSGQQLAAERRDGFIEKLAFSDDGKLVAAVHRLTGVVVWDWKEGVFLGQPLHDSDATGVALVGNRLFTSGTDGNVVVWNLEAPSFISTRIADNLAEIAPGGNLIVSSGGPDEFSVWQSSGVDVLTRKFKADSVAFDATAETMAVAGGNRVAVFGLRPVEQRQTVEVPSSISEISDVGGTHGIERLIDPKLMYLFAPDTLEETVPLVDATTAEELKTRIVRRLAARPNGELASTGNNTTTSLEVCCVRAQLSPDGRLLAIASVDWIWLFDAHAMTLLRRAALGYERSYEALGNGKVLREAPAVIEDIWFSADGQQVMATTQNRVVWRWNIQAGKPAVIGQALNRLTRSLTTAASASRGQIQVASIDWSNVHVLQRDGDLVGISPDGKYLALNQLDLKPGAVRTMVLGGLNAGDYRLTLVNTSNGREFKTFFLSADVTSISFSDDVQIVAATTSDDMLVAWDIKSGRKMMQVNYHGIVLGFIGNRTLVFKSANKISFLPLSVASIIDELCRRSVRNLTKREWQEYFEGEVWRPTCPKLDSTKVE